MCVYFTRDLLAIYVQYRYRSLARLGHQIFLSFEWGWMEDMFVLLYYANRTLQMSQQPLFVIRFQEPGTIFLALDVDSRPRSRSFVTNRVERTSSNTLKVKCFAFQLENVLQCF